jgi:hypothetical protein
MSYSVTTLNVQDEFSISTLKIQVTSCIVISKEHPKVQFKIWKTSHPFESVKMTIICGTELKIEGIVTPETLLFNVTVGGTGPGVIDAISVLLFP